MPLNETDTRAPLMEPKLKPAGWSDSLITREHFYRRDHRYIGGRIYLAGDAQPPVRAAREGGERE